MRWTQHSRDLGLWVRLLQCSAATWLMALLEAWLVAPHSPHWPEEAWWPRWADAAGTRPVLLAAKAL